jgi:hypothetical protein
VKDLVNLLYLNGKHIIVVTGRDGICAEATKKWLADNEILFHEFYYRPEGNMEPDEIIKERIYRQHIAGNYNIDFVLDDRLKVCRMWHSIGLEVLRVGDPDSAF